MKDASAELLAELARPRTRSATCWKITLKSGTIKTFTTFNRDLTFQFLRYVAAKSYDPTDIQSKDTLSVDNLQVTGVLSSPSITEDELRAGIWDFAAIEIFVVNYGDMSQGNLILRCGNLGEVRTGKGMFQAAISGLMQAYSRSRGELTSPSCRYQLYEPRCGVNEAANTVTGTLEGISEDRMTLFDSNRAEAGPTGGRAIVGITNADPGVVSMTVESPPAAAYAEGQPGTLSGIVGMPLLNVLTIVHNPTTDTFELSTDTSDTGIWGSYISGGIFTPLGADSGWFDGGVFTPTSGPNFEAGLSMEIKHYIEGQWSLQLPFPYPLLGDETYSMTAGCNKEFFTGCKAKFLNWLNFGGEKDLRGLDQLLQVGRPGQ